MRDVHGTGFPLRTCVACRTVRPKRDLVRLVRDQDGHVEVDTTAARAGRGAYICSDCVSSPLPDRALRGRLVHAFRQSCETRAEFYAVAAAAQQRRQS